MRVKGFNDLNADGTLQRYQGAELPFSERVDDLLSRMNKLNLLVTLAIALPLAAEPPPS